MTMTEIIRKTATGYKPASRLDDGPEWYSDLYQRAKRGKVAEVTILSPDRARVLLEHNDGNRAFSKVQVSTLAKDIVDGRFVFNGEPIIIADTGDLNDGQHRCAAVIEAGKAIEVLVVAGVPRETRKTVDMGKARSVGDFVHMHGIGDANITAAVAAILLAHETNRLRFSGGGGGAMQTSGHAGTHSWTRFTKAELLSYAIANIKDIRRAMSAVNDKAARKISTYSRLAGCVALIGRETGKWDEAAAFVGAVITGENLRRGMPAMMARNQLLDAKNIGVGATIEIIIRCWNAHRIGKTMFLLRLTNSIPEIAA